MTAGWPSSPPAAYPHQAFRLGCRASGVQFHPEATVADLTAWAELTGLGADDAQAVTHRTRGKQDEITAASQAVAANFARIVRASAAGVNGERGAG